MRSAPTTSIDLTAPDVVADPYPHFAAERRQHEVAWHEPSQSWLAFSHAAVGSVLRNRALARLWHDREPAGYLEPFNLLHRNQMMENEPPEHTRLRRAVAGAFNRGHVERLRPRVQSLADSLLAEVDPTGFDVIAEYAEPLPVLVIAELVGLDGADVPPCAPGRRPSWRCTNRPRRPRWWTRPSLAADEFADHVRAHLDRRRASPAADLTTDLLAAGLSDDELVAAVVLLLNAGHEASVNVFGNGLVALLARERLPADVGATVVEEMLRFDSALQLFERTATDVGDGRRRRGREGATGRGPARLRQPGPRRVRRPRPFRGDSRPQPAPRLRRGAALLPGRPARPDGAAGRARGAVAALPAPGTEQCPGEPWDLRAPGLP